MQVGRIEEKDGKTIITYKDDRRVEFFECECSSAEHLVRFAYFIEKDKTIEDDGLYFSVHLNSFDSFWERLKSATKYLFGYHCRYGQWDEVILKRTDAEKLRDMLNTYINSGLTKVEKVTPIGEVTHNNDITEDQEDGC